MFDAKIPFIDRYNSEMRKSLIDKTFFLDKVDTDIIVDFGCADGATLAFIYNIFPEKILIGYDISEEEAKKAREACPFAHIFTDWNELKNYLLDPAFHHMKKTVVCNSLIHEVYAYGDPEDVKTFWNNIFCNIFDYVVIRDMAVERSASRRADVIGVTKIKKKYPQHLLMEFEHHWGSIFDNWALPHFLLKYRYEANWSREVKENYLPINVEDMMSKFPDDFEPIFFEHFTLPFIRQKVKEDFDIDLQERTHVKFILKYKG